MGKRKTAQKQTRSKRRRQAGKHRAEIIFECLKLNPKVRELAKILKRKPSFIRTGECVKKMIAIGPPALVSLAVHAVNSGSRRTPVGALSAGIELSKESAIDVGYRFQKEMLDFQPLHAGGVFGPLIFEAVDTEEKTITIRIRLNKNINTIKKDIETLLKTVREWAKKSKLKLESPKTQWRKLRDGIEIYKLHEKKKNWKEVARTFYKVTGSADELEKARQRAIKAYKKAEEFINDPKKLVSLR